MYNIPTLNRLLLYALQYCLLSACLGGMCIRAQDFDHYTRLTSRSPLPTELLNSRVNPHRQALLHSSGRLGRKGTRKDTAAFYAERAYYIRQLMLSGKVLFNDPVGTYLNEVADNILQQQPQLRKKLHFFVVKSPSVNAFATSNGLIFVNMGLLAKLQSEAQLAFVLCHEISHFVQKHPLDIFLESRALEKDANSLFRELSVEEVLLAQSNYTREKEQEADQGGLQLYLASPYSLAAIEQAFDLLENAHHPFADLPFDGRVLGAPPQLLAAPYWPGELKDSPGHQPSARYNTHPVPDERKKHILSQIPPAPDSGRHLYLLGQERFRQVRKICRFELCFLYLLEQQYETAIYHTFLLLKTHPQSKYLKKMMGHALYALTKYANAGKFWDVHTPYDEAAGYARQLHYFLETIQGETLNALAIVYHAQLFRATPADKEICLMLEDLMLDFGASYVPDSSSFLLLLQGSGEEAMAEKGGSEEAAGNLLLQYAGTDSAFRALFIQKIKEAHRDIPPKPQALSPKLKEKMAVKGIKLGLEKVVFVNPYYQQLDTRNKKRPSPLQAELKEAEYIRQLQLHAQQLGLQYSMLSTQTLGADDTGLFNDLCLLDEWMEEQVRNEEVKMVSINHGEVQHLAGKYGTPYFVWTSAISLTRPRPGKVLVISAGLLLPLMLPYSIYYATTPVHHSLYYTVVYDIQSGDLLLQYPKLIRMKDRGDVMHAAIYDLLLQMKTAP